MESWKIAAEKCAGEHCINFLTQRVKKWLDLRYLQWKQQPKSLLGLDLKVLKADYSKFIIGTTFI